MLVTGTGLSKEAPEALRNVMAAISRYSSPTAFQAYVIW
jgi:hypothetical protein